MSLFPAYEGNEKPSSSDECKIVESDGGQKDDNWLTNSSFRNGIIQKKSLAEVSSQDSARISPDTTAKNDDALSWKLYSTFERMTVEKSRDRSKPKSRSLKDIYEPHVRNVYYVDRERDVGNCLVDTLPPGARARYTLKLSALGYRPFDMQPKKEAVVRYYSVNNDGCDKIDTFDNVVTRGTRKASDQERNILPLIDYAPNPEEEQKSLVKEFNEKLAVSPHDIELWLRYVKFHDVAERFLKSHRRENKKALCDKKLSIVERALEKNSNSIELLREKCRLLSELYPADEFSNRMENLVVKDAGNIFLWQVYIMATQGSVAMCTVPKIIDMYSKCFDTLRLWSRTSLRFYDERLLEMLFHCFVFLRQAGLWEQMWETLRMNLSLNLGLARDALLFQGSIDEKKLIELEEVILTSGLPLNQLWLRAESLRENSHWISVDRDQLELIGDSHRYVSPEDVTDFVHPLLTRDSNMRLAIYTLITLKVPLLPTGDSILKDLGLEKCGWTIDSIEPILPMFYPTVGELAGYRQRRLLLKGLLDGGLTSGPQYLRYHPAQEPYRDFLRDAFQALAESLPPLEKTSLYIWWLRFERMLVSLCREEPKSESLWKKLKGRVKEFLKKEENRNNLYFYREYALIEREMGRYDNCVTILETAIESASSATEEDRTSLLSLRRTLIEVLLNVKYYNETKKNQVNKVLRQIVPDVTVNNDIERAEAHLRECFADFMAKPASEQTITMESYFLPVSICDNIACYAYLLYANDRGLSEILSIFDACFEHSKGNKYMQERFYENEIALLQVMNERSRNIYNVLVHRLKEAVKIYPNNLYLMSVFAGIESQLPSWKLQTRKENETAWQALSFCIAGRARINFFMERGITDAATASINKLICLHRHLSRNPETQRCPLAWRLFMLLLREQNLSQERGEEVYHESVAQCPWTRSVYIDAAEVAPQLLTQIQDVIREKDLRIHVTPEELDILRG